MSEKEVTLIFNLSSLVFSHVPLGELSVVSNSKCLLIRKVHGEPKQIQISLTKDNIFMSVVPSYEVFRDEVTCSQTEG